MNNFKKIITSIAGKIIIIFILSVIIIFIHITVHKINEPLNQDGIGHEGAYGNDDLVPFLSLKNSESLDDITSPSIKSRIINRLYENHYKESRKLEQDISIIENIQKESHNKFSFIVEFRPSYIQYSVEILINDIESNNFTIHIQKKENKK